MPCPRALCRRGPGPTPTRTGLAIGRNVQQVATQAQAAHVSSPGRHDRPAICRTRPQRAGSHVLRKDQSTQSARSGVCVPSGDTATDRPCVPRNARTGRTGDPRNTGDPGTQGTAKGRGPRPHDGCSDRGNILANGPRSAATPTALRIGPIARAGRLAAPAFSSAIAAASQAAFRGTAWPGPSHHRTRPADRAARYGAGWPRKAARGSASGDHAIRRLDAARRARSAERGAQVPGP